LNTERHDPDNGRLPYALYRAAQVREFDRIAIEEYGLAGELLMERAGEAVFAALRRIWPEAKDITVLAGAGNNAGDGFVVARLAREAGLSVRVLQPGDPGRLRGDARRHAERYATTGGLRLPFEGLPERTDLIVDALFGTGLDRPVEGRWADSIRAANAHRAPIIAVDIPSGLNADTGAVMGEAVSAAATVTFIALKQGLFTGEGPQACGRILFDPLGVPPKVYARQILSARRLDWSRMTRHFGPRPRAAHKGYFGHVLVVGGNLGMGGAARLAAEAAARCGAGLVSLATRPEHAAALAAARPEIMARGVTSAGELEPSIERASVVAVGPGLGHDDWACDLWQRVLESGLPLVMDADALNLLAKSPRRREDWVLTPHPGEAARLLGEATVEVQADRFAAVERLQRRFGGVVALKGAGTLIHAGGTRPPGLCTQGNPGMACGGMGDVLTGLVAGLLAQGLDPEEAAEAAVCLHGASADRAARDGERGLLASDLLPELRPLLNPAVPSPGESVP